MHCLPVRRNVAVADEVLDGPRSVVMREAFNRMVVQMAVLYRLLARLSNCLELARSSRLSSFTPRR